MIMINVITMMIIEFLNSSLILCLLFIITAKTRSSTQNTMC